MGKLKCKIVLGLVYGFSRWFSRISQISSNIQKFESNFGSKIVRESCPSKYILAIASKVASPDLRSQLDNFFRRRDPAKKYDKNKNPPQTFGQILWKIKGD